MHAMASRRISADKLMACVERTNPFLPYLVFWFGVRKGQARRLDRTLELPCRKVKRDENGLKYPLQRLHLKSRTRLGETWFDDAVEHGLFGAYLTACRDLANRPIGASAAAYLDFCWDSRR